MKTNIIKLKGGATLLHTRVKGVTGIYAEFSFKAGSATDPKDKIGVAHFAEHALCEFTTSRFTTEQIQKYRTKFNMTNGATSAWFMRLVFACTKEEFADACDFKLSPIKEIVFNDKDFAWQHDIIKSEIVTRTKTNNLMKNIVYFTKYLDDKNANKLICGPAGNEDTLENIKLADIKKYINTYCTLNNLTISVAGNITLPQLKKVIKDVVYKYIPEGKVEGIKEPNGKWNKPGLYFANAFEPKKAILAIQTNIQPTSEFIDLKTDAVLKITSSCFGKLVFRYFRGREGLCYSCGGGVFNDNRTILSELNFNLEEGNIQKVLDLVPNFIRDNPDLDKEDFEDSKRKLINSVNFDTEDISCVSAHAKGVKERFNFAYGDKYKREITKAIKTVTYEEANELYHQALSKKPYILIISNDEKWKDFDYKKYYAKIKKAYNKARNI